MAEPSDPPPLDLPKPENAFDEKALSDIRRFGWHCITVSDDAHPEHAEQNAARPPHLVYDATFSYTGGVSLTLRHPELILVGRWAHVHAILTTIVELIRDGRTFAVGDETNEVVDDRSVRLGAVSDRHRPDLLTYVDWALWRNSFKALQVIVLDQQGRWPHEPSYSGIPPLLLDKN